MRGVDSYFSILTDRTNGQSSVAKGQSPFAKWLKGKERDLPMYPNAASRKVKIYSPTEVSRAQGLEKIRRKFWNDKAEELCQDRELNKWKATAINGVIDTAWTLTKTAVLVMEADNLRDEESRAEPISAPKPRKQQKVATVDENVKRTLNTHRQLLKINQTLQSLKNTANTTTKKKAKISQAEDAARSAMGELKQAQESLRKALENKRNYLGSASFQKIPPEIANEPTAEDLGRMLQSVLTRTRPREEPTGDGEETDGSDESPREEPTGDGEETDDSNESPREEPTGDGEETDGSNESPREEPTGNGEETDDSDESPREEPTGDGEETDDSDESPREEPTGDGEETDGSNESPREEPTRDGEETDDSDESPREEPTGDGEETDDSDDMDVKAKVETESSDSSEETQE